MVNPTSLKITNNPGAGRRLSRLGLCVVVSCGLLLGAACGKKKDDAGKEKDKSAAGKDAEKKPPAPVGKITVHVHNESSFALLPNGTVRAWGSNAYGQLGFGKINQDVATPGDVQGLTNVDKLYVGGGNLTATACAQFKDGLVKCWGDSELIPGAKEDSTVPIEVPSLKGVSTMCLGSGVAVAVKDGALLTWGRNHFGVLGVGNKDHQDQAEPKALPEVKDVIAVGCGQNHNCALQKSGKVLCWGNNFSGQSDPATMGHDKDVLAPKEVPGIADAVVLGVSANVSCVIGKDKSIKCWGEPFRGKEPSAVPNTTGAVAFSSGHGENTCFIKEGGELWCWGKNAFGECGVDPETKRDIGGVPQKVEGLANVVSVSTAYTSYHTCAATQDGKVFCFGRNRFGALGDGTLTDSHKPREVVGVADAKAPEAKDGFDKVLSRGEPLVLPDKLPAGCAKPGPLTASLKVDSRLTTFPVVYAVATKRERKHGEKDKGNAYDVVLYNYSYDPKLSHWDYDQQPRGMQSYIRMTFTADKVVEKKVKDKKEPELVKTALPVTKGDFEVGPVLLPTPTYRQIDVQGVIRRDTYWFGLGWTKAYKGAKVTYVGDDFICGELELKNDDNSLKGVFVAPVVAK